MKTPKTVMNLPKYLKEMFEFQCELSDKSVIETNPFVILETVPAKINMRETKVTQKSFDRLRGFKTREALELWVSSRITTDGCMPQFELFVYKQHKSYTIEVDCKLDLLNTNKAVKIV